MGLIRTGYRAGINVVLFGNFAVPSSFFIVPAAVLWGALFIGCAAWDITLKTYSGLQVFVIVNLILGAVAVVFFVVPRIFQGLGSAWRTLKRVNGYGKDY